MIKDKIKKSIAFTFQFAMDDFKKKYSGSFVGVAWAFIQPITTILLYWFIFELVFGTQPIDGTPYIVWLITGLLPWFYFSDVISSSTPCLSEYSYLVKNVIFDIDILPITKVISTLIIQFILIFVATLICLLSNHFSGMWFLSIFIYLAYLIILATGFVYLGATLYVFFKDIIQIISIILQIIFWITPICWQQSLVGGGIANIIKYNPLYYVVNGYRSAFIGEGFFNIETSMIIYYWAIALIIFIIGYGIFRKCKKHFADVL